ncbi:MAG: hypothetical protein EBW61_03835 [Rhodobacteraceae bacterium]|nr:hypothetical protein [Paracoccaceae bacterium]
MVHVAERGKLSKKRKFEAWQKRRLNAHHRKSQKQALINRIGVKSCAGSVLAVWPVLSRFSSFSALSPFQQPPTSCRKNPDLGLCILNGCRLRKFQTRAFLTPVVELFWSKERILEVYLNVAEFDEGVFGAEAASLHYFGISSDSLTLAEAARLAAILPDPKGRSASAPTQFVLDRADNIQDGAVLIQKDQRSHCFMD